jgi:hypothetical protein
MGFPATFNFKMVVGFFSPEIYIFDLCGMPIFVLFCYFNMFYSITIS